MEAINKFVAVPSWAYDFCYYYMAVAVITVLYSVYGVIRLLMLPSLVKDVVPVIAIIVALLLSSAVTVVLSMMQFWVCRSALAPHAVKEKFAVKCKTTGDCVAVAGSQSPNSRCTCGDRGFCGGCTMNNNMDVKYESDDMLAGF